MRLTASDYAEPTLQLAEKLLGCLIVRVLDGVRTSGIIVETEAYLAQADPASHSHRGPRPRNTAMFQPAGTLYVYSIHAKYCLNVVSEPAGIGAAVLIRALEPWEGVERMQLRRQMSRPRDLCSGPAKLCQSLAITTADDRTDMLTSNAIWIESAPAAVREREWQHTVSPRIGISVAVEADYRFFIDGHLCVSGLARLHHSQRSWLFGKASHR